jgi:hypothetical protein
LGLQRPKDAFTGHILPARIRDLLTDQQELCVEFATHIGF